MRGTSVRKGTRDRVPGTVIAVEAIGPRVNRVKGPLLVHFSGAQLRRALRRLKRVRSLKNVRSWLELVPVPGSSDPDAVLVGLRCKHDCIAVPDFRRPGLAWRCECHLDVRPGNQPELPTEPCTLMIVGRRFFACHRGTCPGPCDPVYLPWRRRRMFVGCRCPGNR
jgi:hypothetical protein